MAYRWTIKKKNNFKEIKKEELSISGNDLKNQPNPKKKEKYKQ